MLESASAHFERLSPSISRALTIVYDPETRSSRVVEGYAFISELTDADLDRVAGGTNRPDYAPDWDPDGTADMGTYDDS